MYYCINKYFYWNPWSFPSFPFHLSSSIIEAMKRTTKGLIIASSVSLTVSLGLILSFLPLGSTTDKAQASWMKGLNDSALLSSLTIPGSHDSGAFYSLADIAGKCQDASISDQLSYGVRFLDVRLVNYKDSLYVCHGIVNEGMKFSSLLKEVSDYLVSYPSEGLLLSVKEEQKAIGASSSFETALTKAISPYQSQFITERVWKKTVGEIRGKIVLLSRYENSTFGVPAYEGWEDSTTFDLDEMHIQDHYKLTDNASKWDDISKTFDYAFQHPEKLTLNFCSGYLLKGFPPSYSLSTAKDINARLLKELPSSHKGVLICDFVTPSLVSSLLEGSL
jgi:1-phosphatidylinositol phosphodiesterase